MSNKFSFIIPAYNCSETIIKVFESLERQSQKDFEVLVVDDCSIDNSVEVINSYKSNSKLKIKLFSTGVNSGPGVARGIGIKHALGQYICFIDSDDYIDDAYTSELTDRLEQSNPDIIYFGCCQIVGNKNIVSKHKSFNNKEELIALSSGSLCRFAFKKELLRLFPLPAINNAEDIAIIPLTINAASKVEYCDKVLYYYVHNSNSLSSNYSPRVTVNFVKSFDYTLSFLDKPYNEGFEFHGIKTILYGAILNGVKAKMSTDELRTIIDDFEAKFPTWNKNKYINSYSLRKRIFLNLIRNRQFGLMKIYVNIHNLLLKYL